jgi:hypothetical protein
MTLTLSAVFEEVPESEGGGYVAYTEELPGAISEGDTLEEARETSATPSNSCSKQIESCRPISSREESCPREDHCSRGVSL